MCLEFICAMKTSAAEGSGLVHETRARPGTVWQCSQRGGRGLIVGVARRVGGTYEWVEPLHKLNLSLLH